MAEKKKIKLFRCCHIKNDYNGYDKFAFCMNSDCPTNECWCKTVHEMQVCPYFRKNKQIFVTEKDIQFLVDTQKEFLEKLNKQLVREYTDLSNEIIKSVNIQNKLFNCLEKVRNTKIEQTI